MAPRPKKQSSPKGRSPKVMGPIKDRVRLYGYHAVQAALGNPHRSILSLHATRSGVMKLPENLRSIATEADPAMLDRMVDAAPHQGLVLETKPLEAADLAPLLITGRRLLILDQVTDPHNVGALFRSALAFGADGLITQDRHSPRETGALAKSASGALELLPWVRVTNLARSLDQMADAGFWRIGLAGGAADPLPELSPPEKLALVLGAEGQGLRPNVAKHCDQLARIPMDPRVESLNVSNAAAIALYALRPTP